MRNFLLLFLLDAHMRVGIHAFQVTPSFTPIQTSNGRHAAHPSRPRKQHGSPAALGIGRHYLDEDDEEDNNKQKEEDASRVNNQKEPETFQGIVGEKMATLYSNEPLFPEEPTTHPQEEEESKERKPRTRAERIQGRIVLDYRLSSISYFLIMILMLLLSRGVVNPHVIYAATGPYLASKVAWILSDGAAKDYLASDTYKRLTLYQFLYSTCGVLSLAVLARQFHVTKVYAFYGWTSALSMLPSLYGWILGVRGWDGEPKKNDLINDLVEGTKKTIKGLVTVKNVKSGIYLGATWFVGALKVLKLLEIGRMVQSGVAAKDVISRVARFGKLALLTAIMYTLKDAADRDRLDRPTYVQLNFASCPVFASMAAYLYQGAITPLVGAAAFLSTFCGYHGWRAVIETEEGKQLEEQLDVHYLLRSDSIPQEEEEEENDEDDYSVDVDALDYEV